MSSQPLCMLRTLLPQGVCWSLCWCSTTTLCLQQQQQLQYSSSSSSSSRNWCSLVPCLPMLPRMGKPARTAHPPQRAMLLARPAPPHLSAVTAQAIMQKRTWHSGIACARHFRTASPLLWALAAGRQGASRRHRRLLSMELQRCVFWTAEQC